MKKEKPTFLSFVKYTGRKIIIDKDGKKYVETTNIGSIIYVVVFLIVMGIIIFSTHGQLQVNFVSLFTIIFIVLSPLRYFITKFTVIRTDNEEDNTFKDN